MTLFHFLILKFSLDNFLLYALKYLFMVSLVCIISDRSTLKQVLLSNFLFFTLLVLLEVYMVDLMLGCNCLLSVFLFPFLFSWLHVFPLWSQIRILYQVETSSYFFVFVVAFCSVIFWLFYVFCWWLFIIVFCSYFHIGILLC